MRKPRPQELCDEFIQRAAEIQAATKRWLDGYRVFVARADVRVEASNHAIKLISTSCRLLARGCSPLMCIRPFQHALLPGGNSGNRGEKCLTMKNGR